jgi:tRNA-dihydrouridine synthase B
VDAIAVGRGAQGRPWVFQQVNAFLTQERILPEPPASERMRVLLKHVALLVEYKGEKVGMREARKHAAWYIRGVRGAAQYRNAIGKLSTYDELAELAYRVTQAENTL